MLRTIKALLLFIPTSLCTAHALAADLTGRVVDSSGVPLCAMVLASGEFQFSCDPDGPYSLTNLPAEADGTIKRQVYVDGFFPKVDVLQGSTDEEVVMQRAINCTNYNPSYNPGNNPGSAGDEIDISGQILLRGSDNPVCAMVLANGQFQFSCDGTGNYFLRVPLDSNGQFKLQVYADGFAPRIQNFDEFKRVNDVRLARASECEAAPGTAPPGGILKIEVEPGGYITTEPDIPECNGIVGPESCTAVVPGGTSVRITAIPNMLYKFEEWGGCDMETSENGLPVCIESITAQGIALVQVEFELE